jgi:hypothetical protein
MCRPNCLFLLLVAIAGAPPAQAAATSPPGVNLRWDQCYGDGGVQYRNFACDANSGTDRMMGSFELASDLAAVAGLEIYLHLGTASPALPAWWQCVNAGSCRPTAITIQVAAPLGTVTCADWASGTAAGGIGAYQLNSQGANHARIIAGVAVPAPGVALVAGQEYFAFRLSVSHVNSTGTGACAGCLEPACIFLSAIRVAFPSGTPSLTLTQGANYSGSQWVSWQMGYPLNIQHGCAATGGGLFCLDPTAFFDVVPYSVTAARKSTWGAVKSLYR